MYLARGIQASPVTFHSRTAERAPVLLDASLERDGAALVGVKLRDLSKQGFMAECDDFIGIGSAVILQVGSACSLRAEVRWALAGWVGCKFEAELDAKVYDLLTSSTD